MLTYLTSNSTININVFGKFNLLYSCALYTLHIWPRYSAVLCVPVPQKKSYRFEIALYQIKDKVVILGRVNCYEPYTQELNEHNHTETMIKPRSIVKHGLTQ